MMGRILTARLSEKPNQTTEEPDMPDLLLDGGSRVSAENLCPVLEWYKK